MKKIVSLLVVLPAVFVAGMVFAAGSFTDYDEIPDWAQDAAENMNEKGVVTGYSDGSFGPNDNVTRAQLVAVLDRFDELVQDVAERKIQDMIYSMGDLGYVDLPEEDKVYHAALIMSEAGMMRSDMTLSDLAAIHECADDEDCSDPNIEIEGFPEGYRAYSGYLYEFYIVFEGFKNFGQDGWDVEEVYGPFSYYGDSLRYNSADFY